MGLKALLQERPMELRNPRPALRIVDGATAEAALVRAAARGDNSASERLYLTCAPDLTRWVSRVVLGSADAQDIVQDTFVAAFTQLESLKQPEAFRGWLRTIALTHIRRRQRQVRVAAPAAAVLLLVGVVGAVVFRANEVSLHAGQHALALDAPRST